MNNSLATRIFTALARSEMPKGSRPIHTHPGMRVEKVAEERHLCPHCCIDGAMDVVYFDNRITWLICRICNRVMENGQPSGYVMLDNGLLLTEVRHENLY